MEEIINIENKIIELKIHKLILIGKQKFNITLNSGEIMNLIINNFLNQKEENQQKIFFKENKKTILDKCDFEQRLLNLINRWCKKHNQEYMPYRKIGQYCKFMTNQSKLALINKMIKDNKISFIENEYNCKISRKYKII